MLRAIPMLIMILMLAIAIGAYWYVLIGRGFDFFKFDKNLKRYKVGRIVIAVIATMLSCNVFNVLAIVLMHFLVFMLMSDIFVWVINKLVKNEDRIIKIILFIARSGIGAVICTVLYLGLGHLNFQHIVETTYDINTDKKIGQYKIALLSDIHYGTVQEKDVLKDAIKSINEVEPDFVVLCGDIIEDGTSNENMKEVFKVLGTIKNKYGIYYVYGNHDKQNYSKNPSYTEEELAKAITDNGIKILKDEREIINEEIVLIGRDDVGFGRDGERKSVQAITEGVDKNKYIVMLDHQPLDFEENAKAGVDLQLSGHTHAGQLIPINIFNEITGLNYGEYKHNDCTAIVSSGLAGWGFPIRTSQRCEYVIINIDVK